VTKPNEAERDVDAIRLPQWGRVVRTDGVVPYEVQSADGQAIEPVCRYLRDLVAQGRRAGSVRSYAYDLLRWWRWLQVCGVEWDKVTSAEVREFALWLQRTTKPRRTARRRSVTTAGTINPITRKQYPGDRYQARTIRHSNAVVRSFYEFWIERGAGPLVNPVVQERRGGRRPNTYHSPLEPFRPEGRLRYNPPIPKRSPGRCRISSGMRCSQRCDRTVIGRWRRW
jgi:integrase/recombinase XerD